ncbi:hypothetical protein F442_08165 [Phytophthora nicotianae P10297]|uniref:Uncharacterized protein n=1 Tax=Phytophthora nicotianae P10297 TaxID=1317064 RepID=W2ZDM5_PHYNI|nr:hypothetical protein F442_08165 [Phytophthora nicotianae P10297]
MSGNTQISVIDLMDGFYQIWRANNYAANYCLYIQGISLLKADATWSRHPEH